MNIFNEEDKHFLIHYEGTKEFQLDTIDKYEISTIVYGQMCFMREEIKKLEDGFIFVPAYLYKENVIQFQLAVTGKCKKNEIPIDGIRREILEELGFNIKADNKDINIKQLKDKQNNLYFTYLDNLKLESNKLERNFQSDSSDNPKEKVIAWVYQKEIDEELIFNRKRRNSKDVGGEIMGILPVKLVKYILNKWGRGEIKKVDRFGFILHP